MESDLPIALAYCQQRHILLIPGARRSLTLWASGRRIPRWIRRTIGRNRREVVAMIARSETLVCPTAELHKRYWTTFAGHELCSACSRVERGWRRAKASEHKEAA